MGNRFDKKPPILALSDEDIRTLLEMTSFNRDQIYDWHDGFLVSLFLYAFRLRLRILIFNLMQKDCPSGRMTKDKFIETYTFLFPVGKADKFCKQIFKVFDTDHTGTIEFDEFLLSISLTRPGMAEKKLENAFVLYDLDKDGFIDCKEMDKLIEAVYELMDLSEGVVSSHERVVQIMTQLDKDEDRHLSKEEFIQGCLAHQDIREFLIPI